jgi:hypothetical protein
MKLYYGYTRLPNSVSQPDGQLVIATRRIDKSRLYMELVFLFYNLRKFCLYKVAIFSKKSHKNSEPNIKCREYHFHLRNSHSCHVCVTKCKLTEQ